MSTIFPGSASVGQIFDGYEFNGTAWDIVGIDLTADYLESSTASSTYLTQVSASTTYQIKVENVDNTEIGYLNNASANIQTQLNSKASLSGATFSGNIIAPEVRATTKLVAQTVGGDEGGEILLGKAATNTTLSGDGVTIDVWQNRLRIFEQGGDARGGYIDVSRLGNGVATNLTPGLVQMIPSSVTVGSGTGTVSAGGAVTFSGATSISLNGAFTSTYQNYRLLINFYGSVAGNVFAKFRDNSGDISTGYYGCGVYVNIGGTIGPTGLRNNGTEMYIQTSWTDSNQRNLAHFDLQRSPVGTQGAMIGNVWDNWNGTVATHGYHRNDMTNFNGLTIYPASGNLTGTVRIYGYNNG